MLDEQHPLSDEVRAARELSEDLEPTGKTAAEITAGSPPAGSVNIGDLTITRVVDKSTPDLFR